MNPLYHSKINLFDSPALYRIRIHGYLDNTLSDRLGGMLIFTSGAMKKYPRTVLFGKLMDQSELIGILYSLYSMNFSLISLDMIDVLEGFTLSGNGVIDHVAQTVDAHYPDRIFSTRSQGDVS